MSNVLAKHVFDRLLEAIKIIQYFTDTNGTLANGSALPLFRVVELPCQYVKFKSTEAL